LNEFECKPIFRQKHFTSAVDIRSRVRTSCKCEATQKSSFEHQVRGHSIARPIAAETECAQQGSHKSHIRTLIGDFLGTQKDLAECPAFPNRDQEGPFLAPPLSVSERDHFGPPPWLQLPAIFRYIFGSSLLP
jgi:hypothetical protein